MNNVDHPQHYADNCSLECIDTMRIIFGDDGLMTYCLCNAYKYLWRYRYKNGFEDLDKAKWYLDFAGHNLLDVELGDARWNRLNILNDIWEREHKFWEAETSMTKEEYDG